jgi:serine protease Do
VIVSAAKGYIVTNAHVVKDAELITVTLKDSRKFTGKLIGSDTSSDIAIVQIQADNLVEIPFANSNEVNVGDFVAAIGSPFGLEQTVTSGIVSALGRSDGRLGNFESYIQTDAPINMGNSGGALMNLTGKMIGMNTAILAPDGGNIGIGFAIPSNTVKSIVAQIIQFGNVERGYMGILVQNLTPDLASALSSQKTEGALVSIVNQHSPAASAGIHTGDIIIAINNAPVKSSVQLISDVGMLRAGSDITINLLRNGKQLDIPIKLASMGLMKENSETSDPYFYGVTLRDYSELNPNYGYVHGIQILTVAPDSNASRDGLYPGDVIVSANMVPVQNVDALQTAVKNNKNKNLLVSVLRRNGAFFVTLNPAVQEKK